MVVDFQGFGNLGEMIQFEEHIFQVAWFFSFGYWCIRPKRKRLRKRHGWLPDAPNEIWSIDAPHGTTPN